MDQTRFTASIQPAPDLSLISSDSILICEHKLDGTFTHVSDNAESLVGYTPRELIGRNPYDYIHPKDAELAVIQYHQDAILSTASESVRYRFRHQDGHYLILETVA